MSPSVPRARPRARRPARPPFRPRLEALEGRLAPAAFTVSNTNDGGAGSLRQAILDANASPGLDTIQFAVPGAGTHTISPLAQLPFVTDPVVLDGATQPGYAGTPLIQLSGALAGPGTVYGLVVTAGGSLVRGLDVTGFSGDGILLAQNGGDVVTGNYAGTDPAGAAAVPNGFGVVVSGGGGDQVVGNVLSGNTFYGLTLNNTSGDLVSGNLIGTQATGRSVLGNGPAGLTLNGSAAANVVSDNVVGGNAVFGVLLYGPGVQGNTLARNLVGISPVGGAIPNRLAGVALAAGASGNMVGGPTGSYRNVLSDNGADGVFVAGAGTSGNVIESDYVGTNAAGTAAAPDGLIGVVLQDGASGNLVASDVISGNGQAGLLLQGAGTSGDVVASCLVGTNAAGSAALGNGSGATSFGALLQGGAAGNVLYGDLVSGQFENVEVRGAGTSGNVVEASLLGTDLGGSAVLGTNGDGDVLILGASGNTVGGATRALGNVLAGSGSGVALLQSTGPTAATGNVVMNNLVGTNAAGTAALPDFIGVDLDAGAGSNTVAANVVSGNKQYGLFLTGSNNLVQGNLVGTNAAGAAALPNVTGVAIFGTGNTVGGTTPAARNVVSGNTGAGIDIDSAVSGNVIEGNFIGTASDGVTALGNGAQGVLIRQGAHDNTVGGTAAGAGNVIAFNADDGVLVGGLVGQAGGQLAGVDNAVLGNSVYGNQRIGIDLGPDDGVTANGSAGTTGPNNFQPFPALTSATASGGAAIITGTLVGSAATYRVEFFANPSADASGHGQGKRFLGFVTVAPLAGFTPFVAVLSAALAPGEVVSATATDAAGDTSEFSADVTAR
jgi:titin